jgi:hypothetical protein
MAAITFLCRTLTPWALLPTRELGCGSVTTCWNRFAAWARGQGDLTGANPVDRAKRGCKWHLAVERAGVVLSLLLGAATRPDQELVAAVLDEMPPVATPVGGRRSRPGRCHGDKGDDSRHCRAYPRRRKIGCASPARAWTPRAASQP